jgi:hypothetical protein
VKKFYSSLSSSYGVKELDAFYVAPDVFKIRH